MMMCFTISRGTMMGVESRPTTAYTAVAGSEASVTSCRRGRILLCVVWYVVRQKNEWGGQVHIRDIMICSTMQL